MDEKMLINVSRRLLLETTLTEKQIAKTLFISETSLRQLYKKFFNKPPKRYIKFVKLKKAQTFLRTSKLSISEIAYSIGYINTSKFSEAFKQVFGLSPSNYRQVCGFGVERET